MNAPSSRRRILAGWPLPLIAGLVAGWILGARPRIPFGTGQANAIRILTPYRHAGTWVFDDPAAGLVREPFVAGVPEMIDVLTADLSGAADGFRLLFSDRPFPGFQKRLTRVRGDAVGTHYRMDDPALEGWLCPALFRYYPEAPREIYVRAEPAG